MTQQPGKEIPQMVRSEQQCIIDQLHRELGASEDTEHLIDWLRDAWDTLAILRERFDEARAMQLYTASVPFPLANEQHTMFV